MQLFLAWSVPQMVALMEGARIFSIQNEIVYHQLLKEIAYKTVGNRSGRAEPRMVKCRPKAFPSKLHPIRWTNL
jgi:hypothetical protein